VGGELSFTRTMLCLGCAGGGDPGAEELGLIIVVDDSQAEVPSKLGHGLLVEGIESAKACDCRRIED